jgi:hypothetical protein
LFIGEVAIDREADVPVGARQAGHRDKRIDADLAFHFVFLQFTADFQWMGRVEFVKATIDQVSLWMDEDLAGTVYQVCIAFTLQVDTADDLHQCIHGHARPHSAEPFDYDARQRDWYQHVQARNDSVLTEPYTNAATQEMIMAVAAPVSRAATTATPTTVRVVCNNTLTIAVDGTTKAIKVPHNTRFDPQAVKKQLGIAVSQWDEFMYRMRALAERKVQWHEAMGFFMNVLCDVTPNSKLPEVLPNERALRKVQSLYEGGGRGATLESAQGTAWGLLNAVTEYVDHERRARSNEYRMDSAWFGQGAQIKHRALEAALQLAA